MLAIRQVPGWKDIGASIKVGGEVMHPSTYGIQPGEKLSSVLARAGGLSKNAYPYGASPNCGATFVTSNRNRRWNLINRIKSERVQLLALPENTEDQKNQKLTALAETDSTLAQLAAKEPVGRVVIHIQKDIRRLEEHTGADITLKDGDEL